MQTQPLRRGLIIIWTDHQHRIRPGFLRLPAQAHRMGRIIGAGSGNDEAVVPRHLLCPGNDVSFFLIRQGGGFPGGAAQHDGMDTPFQLAGNQSLQHGIVDFAVQKRRDQRRTDTGKEWIFHMKHLRTSLCR